MEYIKPYLFILSSVAFICFSSCSEINRSISSASESEDTAEPNDADLSKSNPENLDFIASFFGVNPSNHQEKLPKLTAHYLDSATNLLFTLPIDTNQNNIYGFEEDELISYPDSIYQKRFSNITSEIPLIFNEQVENFIDLYAIRKKALTERMFGKSMLYFPYIDKVLMEKDLPHDLKYLTMVESALHADAQSHMEAVGLWQIRYRTGKWLGLEINDFLDERRDPYASTKAALTYLERLYGIYGSWPTALAAYNSGPGNVNKAIIKAGGSRNFWSIRKYLPLETRGYVPAFMALVYLNRYQPEHNLRPLVPDLPFQAVDTLRIYHEVSFKALAADLEMKVETLAFLNPALIKKVIPASRKGWPLVVPIQKTALLQEKNAELLQQGLQQEVSETAQVLKVKQEIVPDDDNLKLLEHKVLRGQTMISIAHKYGVSLPQIREWNAMRDDIIRTNQTLKIYVPDSQFASY